MGRHRYRCDADRYAAALKLLCDAPQIAQQVIVGYALHRVDQPDRQRLAWLSGDLSGPLQTYHQLVSALAGDVERPGNVAEAGRAAFAPKMDADHRERARERASHPFRFP